MDFLTLSGVSFNTRIIMRDCLINVDGETFDCKIKCDTTYSLTNPKYTVIYNGNKSFWFHPHHIHPFCNDMMFSIERDFNKGDAVIVVPHFLSDPDKESNDGEIWDEEL